MACAQPNRSLFLRVADADCTSWAGWSGGQPSAWLDHPTATVRKSSRTVLGSRNGFLTGRAEFAWRKGVPKNKKRPVALSSHGTPEQPSPRTAQSQGTFCPFGCKSHVRATGWHEMAIHPTSACFSHTSHRQGLRGVGSWLPPA